MKTSVSENIRMTRELKGFSQDYVAKQLDVTQQAYSQMEKNPDSMTLKRLKDLCKVLDVELIALLDEDNVYVQQNFHQQGGNAATKMIISTGSDENKQLYERLLSEQKEEILFLREQISKGNQ
jgi:transcriptional regulator with XRE-family HTH domain